MSNNIVPILFEVEPIDAICELLDVDYDVYYHPNDGTFPDDVVDAIVDLQERVKELEHPWISVDTFEEIPEGEWIVKFSNKVKSMDYATHVCKIAKNVSTIGDCFAFDRTPGWAAIGYFPIPSSEE